MLGLPEHITACLFDLDGVLTETATLHDAAWKATFDKFLKARDGDGFTPFDADADYDTYVDGKPREDGVRDFLASRHITLPDGHPDDPPDQPSAETTIYGLGNRKNEDMLRRIHDGGVDVYPGSRRYLIAAAEAGLHRAVVSSSANTEAVLKVTGLRQYIEQVVDGNTLRAESLRGKPAPDSYLAGARALGVDPAAAAVFEDALAGVESGRAGHFGLVVGVDRVHQAEALRQHGADVVVEDLAELLDGSE